MDKCPYYQGVCGLDERYICYCSFEFKHCDIFKTNITPKEYAHLGNETVDYIVKEHGSESNE